MRPDVALEWHIFFLMIPCMLVLGLLSHVKLFCDPMDYILPGFYVHMIFSRQEYWSRLSFPPPWDILDPGIEPICTALAGRVFTTEPPRKPIKLL